MPSRITMEIIESYVNCRTKASLQLAGDSGDKSHYELWCMEAKARTAATARKQLCARYKPEDILENVSITPKVLKRGALLILNAKIDDGQLVLHVDGLQKMRGPSALGDFHYIPVLVDTGELPGAVHRKLLGVLAMTIGNLQGCQPRWGILVHGRACVVRRVGLQPAHNPRLLRDLIELETSGQRLPPNLNDHCQICEFRARCHAEASAKDDLRLLRAVTETEAKKYRKRGIFTVTQLSCTYRPKRQAKTLVSKRRTHQHALQALAVREKKIFIIGAPEVPVAPACIYFDIEGDPERRFDYLLGLIVQFGDSETRHSFWADSAADEPRIFRQLLDILNVYDDYRLFTYGGYEAAFLRRMFKEPKHPELVRILERTVNVLSIIHSHVYFPTYSNGLKDIAGHLGFRWSEPTASGIQSIVWRRKWEETALAAFREMLMIYNLEDCDALRKVTKVLRAICPRASNAATVPVEETTLSVSRVEDVAYQSSRRDWCVVDFAIPEFEFVNSRSYFDYQRDRVFIRTNRALKNRQNRELRRKGKKLLQANKNVEIQESQCPHCASTKLTRRADGRLARLAFDLHFSRSGVRRHVTRFKTAWHYCRACKKRFLPTDYLHLDEFFHGLKSWAMYEHIAHRSVLENIANGIRDYFGLPVSGPYLWDVKRSMARYYEEAYRGLTEKIVSGALIHADETEVHVRPLGKAYVWVFTNMEEVVFQLRASREGEFLHELLSGFRGVLVSDFYAAYDSIDCPQQKCLIHLIRDFNQDIRASPWDDDLKALASDFGQLLRSVVETVDQHGLKRWRLAKHIRHIDRFFNSLERRSDLSEAAAGYQKRLLKYRDKLFAFVHHDGVPWNNNNAEHAIKQFAYYREYADGLVTQDGLNDYLVLLSLCATCKYKRVSFLKFLLSGEMDIDQFCKTRTRRMQPAKIAVHPPGWRSFRSSRHKVAKKLADAARIRLT